MPPGLPFWFLQYLETKVVFVIADRHQVVMQRIHYQHHRIRRLIVFTVVIRLERTALNSIARIDQQKARLFFARTLDESGNLREARLSGLFV